MKKGSFKIIAGRRIDQLDYIVPRQKPSLTPPPGSIPLPFFAVGGGNGARTVSVGVVVVLVVVVVVVLNDVFLVDDDFVFIDDVVVGGGGGGGDCVGDISGHNFGSLLSTNYGLSLLDVSNICS